MLEIAKYCWTEEVDSPKLYRFINNYASDSLTLLHLDCIKDFVLTEFTVPFKVVEDLRCPIQVNQTEQFLPFPQLFPKLQKLWVYLLPVDGKRCAYIECNLPHLQHFALGNFLLREEDRVVVDSIEEFLRKNTHIRSIEMKERLGHHLLPFVNHQLANLQSLSADDLSENEALTFNHVKHLTLQQLRNPENTSFPRLESLFISFYEADNCKQVNDFLKKHRTVKKLHLHFNWQQRIELQRTEKIIDELHHLDEVKLVFMTFLTEDIVRLVQEYKNWKKFEFLSKWNPDLQAIRNQFEGEYNITSVSMKSSYGAPWRGLLLEKKN